ncbi:MAG: iron-containing alcohol dehydrogenase [Planctomycetota bacterium]
MEFEFATVTRIIFGAGKVKEVSTIAAGMGKRALVITGKGKERAGVVFEQLKDAGIVCFSFQVGREPTAEIVKTAVKGAKKVKADMVVSIGGGSVIDTGKAVAAMLTNKGHLEDYLEVVGKGGKIANRAAPYIAIPTTAGTGAEVTRNAVISVPEEKVKVSMRSPLMLPWVALVDPELTYSMPHEVTASTGMDALTQLLEAYVSKKANPMTDGICREGLMRAGRSLRKAYNNGSDKQAREDMAIAGLFGGLTLTNAKLGAVHGFAGPLGGETEAPHGVICARLLPLVFEANVKALESRGGESGILERFDEVAKMLTGDPGAKAKEGTEWLQELCEELEVPGLSKYGLKEEDIERVTEQGKSSSSMKGNSIELTDEELAGILSRSL